MKKKLILLLFAIVLCVSGCGTEVKMEENVAYEESRENVVFEEEHKDIAVESTETVAEEVDMVITDVEEDEFWPVKVAENLSIPVFKDATIRDQEIVEGFTIQIATSPLLNNIDEVEEALKQNEFLNEKYELYRAEYEEVTQFATYTEGDFHNYGYGEQIIAKESADAISQPFFVTYYTDYSAFDTTNKIYVRFDDIEQKSNMQGEVVAILETIWGKEISNYLVYYPNTNSKPGMDDRHDAYVSISSPGGHRYELIRDFTYNSHSKTWALAFSVELEYPGFYNKDFPYYDGGQESMLSLCDYNFSKITEHKVSDIDLNRFSTMLPEFTAINSGGRYLRNNMSEYRYKVEYLPDGSVLHNVKVIGFTTLLEGVNGFNQPEYTIDYSIREKDGTVCYVDVYYRGKNIYKGATDKTKEQIFNAVKEQVDILLPGVDLIDLIYEESKDTYRVQKECNYLGLESECIVDMEVNEKSGSWYVDMKTIK